jgi:hypothetical protein
MSGQTHVTGHVHLQRPAVDADGVVEIDAVEDVFAGQDMPAEEPAGLPDPKLGCGVHDVGFFESRDPGPGTGHSTACRRPR